MGIPDLKMHMRTLRAAGTAAIRNKLSFGNRELIFWKL